MKAILLQAKTLFFPLTYDIVLQSYKLSRLNLAPGLVPPGLVPSSQKTFNKRLLNE